MSFQPFLLPLLAVGVVLQILHGKQGLHHPRDHLQSLCLGEHPTPQLIWWLMNLNVTVEFLLLREPL